MTAAGAVTVHAIQTAIAEATTIVGSVGVVGVGGAEARSTVGGTVEARLGPAAAVSAGGALTVTAETSARSHAKAEGGSGGGAAITAMIAEASTTLTTRAAIEQVRQSPRPPSA